MKTCIITGAATGIGRATAIELASREDISNFVLIALGMNDLEQTKSLMEKRADKEILIYDQDITKYDEVKDIIDSTYRRFGRIDALLNIAGYAKPCPFLDIPIDMFKLTFEVNVFAMFNMTQCVVRYMKETGGVIVNIASTSGSTPRPGWLPYAASKSAVIGFSRTLAQEVKDFNIKIFNLSPGRCATAMRAIVKPGEDQANIMKPESVADMISFFVDHPDCNIDGQDIIIRQLD
jgi:3-oxoacyl-[acyl-carrier protein] reductase